MDKKIIPAALLLFAIALSACQNEGEPSSVSIDPAESIVINNGEPITLLLDLNGLMPTTNTEPTEQQPTVFRSIQDITDEFIARFPNVSVEWAYSKKSVGDWAQWMTTQVASENAPDIVMMHGSEYSDRGWYEDLTDILEEPNVFIPEGQRGSVHWKDQFPKYQWLSDMTCDAANRICAVPIMCYPGTATAYYYNTEIFDELNLDVPTNWEEFKAICDKINAESDYVAVGPWSLNATVNVDVWDIQFSLGPTYAKKIQDQWDYNGDGVMTQDEKLRATYEGVFYGQGPNIKNILSLYNEVKYKYNSILQTGAGSTNYQPMWTSGQVAMMEDGMWRIDEEKVDALRKFEFGIFPTPLANSETSEYCADFQMGHGAYNPPICESFNICKQASEQKGPGHLQASKLFLMWLSVPENINRMVDEVGGQYVGAVYDTIIPASVTEFLQQDFPRTPNCNWTRGVTVATRTKMSRYFQYWVADRYSNSRFFQNYDRELHQGCMDMIQALSIDTSGWDDGYNPDFDYGVLDSI
ncbi:MAG: carbohydrate ABC transporter substrate-binding protein [Bacilli bacterium]|nr:carbohydrate ABC transporter substrate-binding protein [Bacilli bacterium]